MKKFQETMQKWVSANKQLYKDCEEYLRNALEKNGNSVEFDAENCEFVTVTYDGGRHPEYNSNAFSQVLRAYIKDGEMYLETEDANDYPISRIEASELYDICNYIEYYIMHGEYGR